MICWIFGNAVLLEVSDMTSSSRMKFCMMAIYYKFNKLQPAGCNRVSPACSVLVCSVLLYTICIVFVGMMFLFNDHNKRSNRVSALPLKVIDFTNGDPGTGLGKGDVHDLTKIIDNLTQE